jgi:hypothetical protein
MAPLQMPNPTHPKTPEAPPREAPYIERLVLWLLPYFLPVAPDLAIARGEILETLASYGARTRAELLSAAQIIAFGFSALDTLAEAKTAEMSLSMRLRYKGCANNLNRSGQKTEQILAKRQASDVPEQPGADPYDDLPDPQFEEALTQAKAEFETHRSRLAAASPSILPPRPNPAAQQDANKRMWGQAMVNVLAEMGMPVQPAAR